MPLYEFQCEICKSITEKQLPITSNVKTIPCESKTCSVWWFDDIYPMAHRIISKSNFHLKGSGWSTQYKPNTSSGSEDEPYRESKPWVEPK